MTSAANTGNAIERLRLETYEVNTVPVVADALAAVDALRRSALRVLELEQRLEMERRERDDLALRLVDQGHTWREVADAAGFANPYIATLKKRRP